MKLTPVFGWPVAEPTDVAKQYPANIDDPFKAALEADMIPGDWVACALGSGFTGAAYARRCGTGIAQMAGTVTGTFTGSPTICTLPPELVPANLAPDLGYAQVLLTTGTSGATGLLVVRLNAVSGTVMGGAIIGTTPPNVRFDGFVYAISNAPVTVEQGA